MLRIRKNVDDDDTKQQSLPLSLHPDDAKDKVFTAILKALLKMDNKPSSPKELANVIIKSDFATLGGSTPFATVSSRISQHFKRAAQHKPPRSPILTRHVVSSHSRKINYSLATESILPSPTPSPTLSENSQPQQKSKRVVQALSLENDHENTASTTGLDDTLTCGTKDEPLYCQDLLNETLDAFDETTMHRPLLSFATAQQQSGYQPIDNINALWTKNDLTAEDDFGLVHLPDSSTAHHSLLNIESPETVPISELDDYFGNDKDTSAVKTTHNATDDTHLSGKPATSLHPPTKTLPKTDDTSTNHSWPIVLPLRNGERMDEFSQNHSILCTDPTSDRLAEQEHCDTAQNTSTDANLAYLATSYSEQSLSATFTGNTCDNDIYLHFDDGSDDESNTSKNYSPTHPMENNTEAALLNVSTLTKILELMHNNQANFTTLHQLVTSTPDLTYLSPIVGQIQSLATYLRSTTNDPDAQPSSSSSNTQQGSDINAILTKFPALKVLLDKQQNVPEEQPSPIMVHTTTSTTPAMYITVIDDIAVCVAVLPSTLDTPEYRIMRRLDLDYVNGTTLLKAGGLDTERERSVIFSLEKDRLRMRRHDSSLNGTWLPLKRAQHLAATCSIEHRLGSFLDDHIEAHFPTPLPIHIVKRQQIKPISPKYSSWSWATDDDLDPPAVLSRDVSLTGAGTFWSDTQSYSATGSDTHLATQEQIAHDTTGKTTCLGTTDDDATDTDSDTEEFRRKVKRDYDAAINAMPTDSTLDELVNRRYPKNRPEAVSTRSKRRRKQRSPNNNIANQETQQRKTRTSGRHYKINLLE